MKFLFFKIIKLKIIFFIFYIKIIFFTHLKLISNMSDIISSIQKNNPKVEEQKVQLNLNYNLN